MNFKLNWACLKQGVSLILGHGVDIYIESKKSHEAFWHFVPNGWKFLVQILHAYYTLLSMLDYNYFQLWRSYAILSAITQRAFQPMVDILSM